MLKMLCAALIAGTAAFTPVSADETDEMPVRLHRFTAPLYAWNTNSYWLETGDAIVLIDAQLLSSDAQYLAAQIKATGKPVKGAFITHGHIDHIGGLEVLRAELGEFPIYATAETTASIPPLFEQARKDFPASKPFGEPITDTMILPDHVVKVGETLDLAGLHFEIHGGGPGEAPDNIAVYVPELKALFAGDISWPLAYYFAGEGHPSGALRQLETLCARFDGTTYSYTGHGNPSRVAEYDAEIAYLKDMIASAHAALANPDNRDEQGRLKKPVRQAIAEALIARYPHRDAYGLDEAGIVRYGIYGAETEYLRDHAGGAH